MGEDTQELAHPPDIGEERGTLKQKTGSHIELNGTARGFPTELGNIHQIENGNTHGNNASGYNTYCALIVDITDSSFYFEIIMTQ